MKALPPASGRDAPWHSMPSALALLAANLVTLAGVLLAHWPMYPLMLLFWVENVIIGLYTIAKIILAGGSSDNPVDSEFKAPDLAPMMYPPFFLFHYGMFAMVHGLFVVTLFGHPQAGRRTVAVDPVSLLPVVWEQLSRHGLVLAVIAIAVSHGVSFWTNYLKPRRYLEFSKKKVMMAPYGRVVLLHLVILGGAFAIQAIGPGPLPLVVLILVKTGMDLAAHLKEHRTVRAAGAPAAMLPQVPLAQTLSEINDRPLAHYLGSWRLTPDQAGSAGWCNGVEFSQDGGQLRLRLSDDGARGEGVAAGALERLEVRGEASRIEFIEARLRGNGRERILRFSASGERADRIDLSEIQQPEGRPRDMQARSSSFARGVPPR